MTTVAHQAAQLDVAFLGAYLERVLPGFLGPVGVFSAATGPLKPGTAAVR